MEIRHQRWSRGDKARGKGQGHKKSPRPRPRTAFPRTDTLEAKDRNVRGQEPRTQPQVFSKKSLQKKILSDLQFIGVARIFDWGGGPEPQITCNDVVKNFQKRNFLWDKSIVRWKIRNHCLLALNRDFAKGQGLN